MQNRWVGTHRINLQEPAEIILTAANYRPLLVEHRLYDSHDVELGMMSPYEGMEDTISRMLASGSYVIRSYSSALCYSGKIDCELRMQKNEFSFNSQQDKPKRENMQRFYSNTLLFINKNPFHAGGLRLHERGFVLPAGR